MPGWRFLYKCCLYEKACISDLKQPCMCDFNWTQWQQTVEMFFYRANFCFLFISLFLKKMNVKCKQTLLLKPILKILPIYRKNILGQQFSQVIPSEYLFRLLQAQKFQIFSTKLKSDSHLPKKLCYLLHWKPFKNDE